VYYKPWSNPKLQVGSPALHNSKTIMDQRLKDVLADIQLKGIAKLIGGTVHHQSVIDSKGAHSRRVIITYENRKVFS
jgi:UDP-2,3-diacylglucosamine pyrophosphatase LpxH